MFHDQKPENVLQELKDALSTLEKYGVIHDDRIDKMNELMAHVYETENDRWNQANIPEYEDYYESASVHDLLALAEDKETFIKDFITAIQVCCDSSFHLNLDPVATIISSRSNQS